MAQFRTKARAVELLSYGRMAMTHTLIRCPATCI